MVKQLVISAKDLGYFKKITTNTQCCAGIITGQATKTKDYVSRVIKCPTQFVGEEEKIWNSIKDIDAAWVAGHASQVIPSLPGGIAVIGVFLTAKPEDSKLALESLKKLVYQISKQVAKTNQNIKNHFPNSEEISNLWSVVHVDSKSGGIVTSRCYDVTDNKDAGNVLEVKQIDVVEWDRLDTSIDFIDRRFNFSGDLSNFFKSFCAEVSSAQIVINSEFMKSTDILNSASFQSIKASKKRKNPGSKPQSKNFSCQVFVPNLSSDDGDSVQLVKVSGVVTSKAYVCLGTTVGDALNYLKQDLIRSIYQRCAIILEDGETDTKQTTEIMLPRRIFASQTEDQISYSEYVLHGEGLEDCLERFKDNLDAEFELGDITKESVEEFRSDDVPRPVAKDSEELDEVAGNASRTNVVVAVFATGVAFLAWMFSGLVVSEN